MRRAESNYLVDGDGPAVGAPGPGRQPRAVGRRRRWRPAVRQPRPDGSLVPPRVVPDRVKDARAVAGRGALELPQRLPHD